MPIQIPDWLSQIANDNPNLVEDSPTFRAVEQTSQKRNLVKATNQAMKQHAEEVKQQQIKAVTAQVQALKALKDKTDAIHANIKSMPDYGATAKGKNTNVQSGPATSVPPKDPNTLPGPGDEPIVPRTGEDQNVPAPMPGQVTLPYTPSRPSTGSGDVPSNSSTPGTQTGDPYSAPVYPGSSPTGVTDDTMAKSQDPSQSMSVQDVMSISQATGLPPQKVASMILMGDTVLKTQPPDAMNTPSPMEQAPQASPSLPQY